MRTKKRTAFSILWMVLLVVLSLGINACSGSQSPARLPQISNLAGATPTATIFIPKQAPFVAASLASPVQLAQTWAALTDGSAVSSAPNRLLGTPGVNFGRDVQPWMGNEITVAVTTTDLDRDPGNGIQPGYLLVLTTKNPEKSQAFLQLLWQKRAVPSESIEVETYQGVNLTYQAESDTTVVQASAQVSKPFQTIATANIGDRYVLVANHPKVLRDAINNAQAPDLNLNSTPSYQTAIKTLSDQQVAWIFMNLPDLGQWSQIAGKPSLEKPTALPTYRYDKLAIAIRTQNQGFVADTLFFAAPEQAVPAFQPSLEGKSSILSRFPQAAMVSLTGQDLTTLWPGLEAELQGYPALLSLLQQPQQAFEKQVHLPLFTGAANWVTGEYGLAVVPTENPLQPDVLFMAERTPELEIVLTQFNDLAKQQGYTVVDMTVAGQPVTTWTQLQTPGKGVATDSALNAQVAAAHTTIGNYELFATSVEGIQAALTAEKSGALTEKALYKTAIAPLLKPNAGHLYVEWAKSSALGENAIPLLKWLRWSTPSLFEHLKTITVSSSASEAGMRRNLIVLQMS